MSDTPFSYAALLRPVAGGAEVLLAQKNVYLPPNRHFQFAAIPRSASQYVIPGGRLHPSESPAAAAARHLAELGITVDATALQPLLTVGPHTFFQHATDTLDPAAVNAAITAARTATLAYHHVAFVPLARSLAALGPHAEHDTLPWVTSQLTRALSAGFSHDLIRDRVHESHAHYTAALTALLHPG